MCRDESFSLIKKTEQELVQAFRGVGSERRKSIVELASQGVEFSEQDVNEMLQRRKRLREFEVAFDDQGKDERWWQNPHLEGSKPRTGSLACQGSGLLRRLIIHFLPQREQADDSPVRHVR